MRTTNLFFDKLINPSISDLPKPIEYRRAGTVNAFETSEAPGENIPSACGLLSLLCGPLLKGTPFEEQQGINDNSNKRLIEENPSNNNGILI